VSDLSIGQARRLALGAQGFGGLRPTGRIDRRHLHSTMGRLELLQLDSVPVVIRTQYMPLFSRLGPYRTELLDEVAYRDHAWFEAWSHEASLLPVESEPLWRWHKQGIASGRIRPRLAAAMAQESGYVRDVLAQVVDRGPLKAGELDDPRRRQGDWWSGRSIGTVTLDWLWRIGAVGVRRVGNFEKQYDVFERVVPDDVRARPTPDDDDALRELLARAGRALGVATADDLIDYFRLPKPKARLLVADLVEDGDLVETTVEGWNRPAYRHLDVAMPREIRRTALLSPFDPIVWNRDRADRLFDFQYKIEIYVPEAKRQFGYYVLPLLWRDRLAARFDLKTWRDDRVLHVRGSFAEPWVDVDELASDAHAELLRLAELVGADELRIESNGNLAPALSALSR
jgi:uncharacterized protein